MGSSRVNDEMWVSFFSLIFYGFVASFSADHFITYYKFGNGSKISNCRRLFFGILSISAMLDIPVWLLCIGFEGPSTCVMETPFFKIFQCFHMLALCGYATCLGITTLLWSDILTDNEDKPIIDFKTPDNGRKFFYALFALYFFNELTVILSILLWMDTEDPNEFMESNDVYGVSAFTEPFLICLLAGSCLFTGVKLQQYVVSVRLGSHLQREFLIQLNVVLFSVTSCYLLRAVFVFTMAYDFNSAELRGLSFAVWTLCTRWLPNVGASLCLFVFMSRSNTSNSAKYGSSAAALSLSHNASWVEPLVKPEDALSDQLDTDNFSDPPDMPRGQSTRNMNGDALSSPNPIFRYEHVSRSFSEPDELEAHGALRFPDILLDMDGN